MSDGAIGAGLGAGLGIVAVFVVCGGLYGCPIYNVWSAQKSGEATLAEADQSRQVQIAQSKAKADAAVFEANAEVTRAQGVAKANQIIGDSLKGNEAYLRYLWINGLENNKNAVIYVPTEANLPLLEATRGMKSPSQ